MNPPGEAETATTASVTYFDFGHPSVAFGEINSYARDRLVQHLRRRSQRPFRPPEGVSLLRADQALRACPSLKLATAQLPAQACDGRLSGEPDVGKSAYPVRGLQIVDAAYRVHTTLGPGLLESIYEAALAYELEKRGLRFSREQVIPVVDETVRIHAGFHAELIVEDAVIVESRRWKRSPSAQKVASHPTEAR